MAACSWAKRRRWYTSHEGKAACLWQEHLAGSEEVADDVHAVHEGALDDLQRRWVLAARPRLLGILRLFMSQGGASDEFQMSLTEQHWYFAQVRDCCTGRQIRRSCS